MPMVAMESNQFHSFDVSSNKLKILQKVLIQTFLFQPN